MSFQQSKQDYPVNLVKINGRITDHETRIEFRMTGNDNFGSWSSQGSIEQATDGKYWLIMFKTYHNRVVAR